MIKPTLTYTLIIICVLSACSPQRSPVESDPNFRAQDQIQKSFLVTQDGGLKLWIHREALDKEFLLMGNLVVQYPVAMPLGLQSRVVMFKRDSEHELTLFESSLGQRVDDSIPQTLFLARFPVIESSGKWIAFDFNQGMQTIYINSGWWASDFEGSLNYRPREALPVLNAFLEQAHVEQQRNHLELIQIAQVASSANGESIDSVVVKYDLRPYRPNPQFKLKASPGFTQFGFFEVPPQFIQGRSQVLVSRFDETKPIRFALSNNTPKEFRQAIKDGVLYWERVLGSGRVLVDMAPEGVSAPNRDHNVIQWVNWVDAGFAYADAQMDPRTGEILRAQVFMTSVFAANSLDAARLILQGDEPPEKLAKALTLGLQALGGPVTGCQRQHMIQYRQSLAILLQEPGVTDQMVARLSADFIRDVIAHEVGHVLGLRHNFAGSLHTNIKDSDWPHIMKDYRQGTPIDSKWIPGSSVMEYQRSRQSLLSGYRISQGFDPLDYDLQATKWLYDSKKPHKLPPFCTDSQVDSFLDCQRFTQGSGFFESVKSDIKENLESTPVLLLRHLLALKVRGEIKAFDMNAKEVAQSIYEPLQVLKSAFYEGLALTNTRQNMRGFASHRILSEETRLLLAELQKSGGLENVLALPSSEHLLTVQNQSLWLLEEVMHGRLFELPPTSVFSDQERAYVELGVREFFKELKKHLAFSRLEIFLDSEDNERRVLEGALGDEYFSALSEILGQALWTAEHRLELGYKAPRFARRAAEGMVSLPLFFYPLEQRLKALGLFDHKQGVDPTWGIEQVEVLKVHRLRLAEALKGLQKIKIEHIHENSRPQYSSWQRQQKFLLTILSEHLGNE